MQTTATGAVVTELLSDTGVQVPCSARLIFVLNFAALCTLAYSARAWRICGLYYKQDRQIGSLLSIGSLLNFTVHINSPEKDIESTTSSDIVNCSESSSEDRGTGTSSRTRRKSQLESHEPSDESTGTDSHTGTESASFAKKEKTSSDAGVMPPPVRTRARRSSTAYLWLADRRLPLFVFGVGFVALVAQIIPFLLSDEEDEVYSHEDPNTCQKYRNSTYVTAVFLCAFTNFVAKFAVTQSAPR